MYCLVIKMKYFLLSVTNTCNKSCSYCVVKQWVNNPNHPDRLTVKDLIVWMSKIAEPDDIVKITGGEPTLWKGLPELLDFLSKKRIRTIMETNGAIFGEWRKKYANMIVILSRHDTPQADFDKLKSYLLNWDCAWDSYPDNLYQTDGKHPVFVSNELSRETMHPFTKSYFVTNDGVVSFLPCDMGGMGSVWDFTDHQHYCCPWCPYFLGAWNNVLRIGNTNLQIALSPAER